MKNWKDKLTKDELNHLSTDANVFTWDEIMRTFVGQEKMREDGTEPCWECRFICQKLGLIK